MIIETVPLSESLKDAPEYELQTYLYELALQAYSDKSVLDTHNAFVPVLAQDKWVVYFGTEEELKPYNYPNDLLYKIEWLCDWDKRDFKDADRGIWNESADYMCDYINPVLYPEDYIDDDDDDDM